MIELLTTYSVEAIIIFIIALAIAIKEVIGLVDFFRGRVKKRYETSTEGANQYKEIINQLGSIKGTVDNIVAKQDEQYKQIKMLKESDKDQLKSTIVKEYHYFCHQRGWIDDFSMDALEKCYSHYKDMGGNSYISDLMHEIRKLPHVPPQKN